MEYTLYALAAFVLLVYLPLATLILYICLMHIDRMRWVRVPTTHTDGSVTWAWVEQPLHPVMEFIGFKVLFPLGFVHNFLNNALTMTIVFGFDPPREWGTTGRMNRYRYKDCLAFRRRWAHWISEVFLNWADRRGTHT